MAADDKFTYFTVLPRSRLPVMGFSFVVVTKEKHMGKKVNLLVSKTQAGQKKKGKENGNCTTRAEI